MQVFCCEFYPIFKKFILWNTLGRLLVCYRFQSGRIKNKVVTYHHLRRNGCFFFTTYMQKDTVIWHTDLPKIKLKNIDIFFQLIIISQTDGSHLHSPHPPHLPTALKKYKNFPFKVVKNKHISEKNPLSLIIIKV